MGPKVTKPMLFGEIEFLNSFHLLKGFFRSASSSPTSSPIDKAKLSLTSDSTGKSGMTNEDSPSKVLSEWQKYFDSNSGNPYYYNKKSGETTWDDPSILLQSPIESSDTSGNTTVASKPCSFKVKKSNKPVTEFQEFSLSGEQCLGFIAFL